MIGRWYGLARSLLTYHGQPWRRRRMERLYAPYVRPGDLCFDVGAHVGNRVGCFLRLGARVVAVEPQPSCVDVLRRLYGGRPGVTLLPLGLAERPGRAELRVSTWTPTVSSFSEEWIASASADDSFRGVRWDGRVEVELTTLDALIAEHGEPSFVKIDVEGFELEVLRGLSRPVRACSFEFLPLSADRAVACVERLETLGGYTYRTSRAETHRLEQEEPWSADRLVAFLRALRPGERSGDVYALRADASG